MSGLEELTIQNKTAEGKTKSISHCHNRKSPLFLKDEQQQANDNQATTREQQDVVTNNNATATSAGCSHDVTDVFEPAKIKAILYREEPKMARISKSSLEWIGTTCAIFLKTLVSQAQNIGKDDIDNENKERGDFVTLHKIRKVVDTNPSLEMFQSCLKDIKDKETGSNNNREYVPIRERKRRAQTSSSSGKADKILKRMEQGGDHEMIDNGPLKEAVVKTTLESSSFSHGKIIADEDDYD